MWVDVNEKLGRLKEGFNKGVYKYASKVKFDPGLVNSVENSYGFAAATRLKTLKDNFSRLEQVSMSTRTIEKKKIKAREEMNTDKYGLKQIRGEAYLKERFSSKNKIAENLHRRTTSNLFRLTTIDKFDKNNRSLDIDKKSNHSRYNSLDNFHQMRRTLDHFHNAISINDLSKSGTFVGQNYTQQAGTVY